MPRREGKRGDEKEAKKGGDEGAPRPKRLSKFEKFRFDENVGPPPSKRSYQGHLLHVRERAYCADELILHHPNQERFVSPPPEYIHQPSGPRRPVAEMQAAMTEMLANYDSDTDTSGESMEDDNSEGSEQDGGESETEEDTRSLGKGRTDEENDLGHKTAKGKTMGKGKATLILKKPLKRKQPWSKESKAADERRAKRPKLGLQALVVPASEERDSLYGSGDDKARGRLNVRPEEDIPLVYPESSHTISDNEGGPALCDSPISFPHSALQEEAAARKKLNTAPPPASLAANTRSRPKTAPAETNVFNPPRLTIKLRNPRAPLAKAPAEDKDTKRPSLIIKLKASPIMALQEGKSAVGFDQIQQQAIQGNIQTEGAIGCDGESENLEHNGNEANGDSDVVKIEPRRVPTHKDSKTLSIGIRDETLLDIETKHSITGEIKTLFFTKLARDQIDWKSKVHIDLIRTWRRQIYRRGGHKKRKESVKWHDEELSWLDQYFLDLLARIRNDTRIKMPTNKKTAVDFNAHFQGRVLFDSDGQPMERRGRRAESSIASQCTRRQAIKDAKEEADSIKASAPKGKGKGKIVIEVVSELEQEAPSPAEWKTRLLKWQRKERPHWRKESQRRGRGGRIGGGNWK